MMNITVQLLSPLKEFSGVEFVSLTLPEPTTAEQMLERMAAQYPAMLPHLRDNAQVIINNELVHQLHLLHDGDEVQLSIPISGG